MDKDFIAFLAIGIVAIGMAVFGKYRPEVVFRNYKGVIAPDKQRFFFYVADLWYHVHLDWNCNLLPAVSSYQKCSCHYYSYGSNSGDAILLLENYTEPKRKVR